MLQNHYNKYISGILYIDYATIIINNDMLKFQTIQCSSITIAAQTTTNVRILKKR